MRLVSDFFKSLKSITQKNTFPITWKVMVVIPVSECGKHGEARFYGLLGVSKASLSY